MWCNYWNWYYFISPWTKFMKYGKNQRWPQSQNRNSYEATYWLSPENTQVTGEPFFFVFLFPFPFFLCGRVWTPYHCFGSGAETTRRSLGIFPAREDLWYALGHRLDYDSALESLDLATETSQQVHDQESILRLDLELWSQFDTGTQDSVEYNSNLPTPRSLDTGLWW